MALSKPQLNKRSHGIASRQGALGYPYLDLAESLAKTTRLFIECRFWSQYRAILAPCHKDGGWHCLPDRRGKA